MRNVLEYVLRGEKVKEGHIFIAGPYAGDTINYDEVYQTWIKEKQLWNKDSGRMYAHNIISFHKDEKITAAQCLEIGRKFVGKFFDDRGFSDLPRSGYHKRFIRIAFIKFFYLIIYFSP